jgi:hypothetical protein
VLEYNIDVCFKHWLCILITMVQGRQTHFHKYDSGETFKVNCSGMSSNQDSGETSYKLNGSGKSIT